MTIHPSHFLLRGYHRDASTTEMSIPRFISIFSILLCLVLNAYATAHYRNATPAVWTSPHFVSVLHPQEALISTRSAKLIVERQTCSGFDTLCHNEWCCPDTCCGHGCCPPSYSCMKIGGVAGCCAPGQDCDAQTVTAVCVDDTTQICASEWCCDLDETCGDTDYDPPLCISSQDAAAQSTPPSSFSFSSLIATPTTTGGGSSSKSSNTVEIVGLVLGIPGAIASTITLWHCIRRN